MFKPATWLEAAENFPVQCGLVLDEAYQASDVNVVKVVIGVWPIELGVIQLKLAVCGNLNQSERCDCKIQGWPIPKTVGLTTNWCQ